VPLTTTVAAPGTKPVPLSTMLAVVPRTPSVVPMAVSVGGANGTSNPSFEQLMDVANTAIARRIRKRCTNALSFARNRFVVGAAG
jgi:hypothetical protein